MRYLQHVPVQHNPLLNQKGLDKTILNQDDELSQSSLATLIKNQVFETFEVIQPRFSDNAGSAGRNQTDGSATDCVEPDHGAV